MDQARTTLFATAIVIGSGTLWGVYWLPVRLLTDAGLPGAWGTFAITLSAAVLLLPFAYRNRSGIRQVGPLAACAIAAGGIAFALYSIGFVYGRVAIIALLFFLTPVWSTLIGRYVFGWITPLTRICAIIVGLLGLAIMLSADGSFPMPRNLGEWMALVSGILWSLSSTGIRAKSTIAPAMAACIFAASAAFTSLCLAIWLSPFPQQTDLPQIMPIALVTGAVWWGLTMIALMWATMRLDPARVGILLMAEVLVGALSAAMIAGEHLSPLEILGGVLVLSAGVLEVWPTKAAPKSGAAPTGRT